MTSPSTSDRAGWVGPTLEVTAVIGAAAVVLASLATAAWVLRAGSSGTEATPGPAASESPRNLPSVLSGGFAGLPLAARDRDVLVGVGARRGGPVDVVVIPSDETDVRPDAIRVRVGATTTSGTEAVSCGRRCLRFPALVLLGTATELDVEVDRPAKETTRVTLQLPARLPRSASPFFQRTRVRMLALDSYAMREALGSGLGKTTRSTWWFQAPDRMRYVASSGSKAVVIGSRRWDWLDGQWEQSSGSKVRVPAFSWQAVRKARLLGRTRVDGKAVRVLAAATPGADFPTWFRLYVTEDLRVLRSEMLTTAHFMVDTYDDFDTAAEVRAPE